MSGLPLFGEWEVNDKTSTKDIAVSPLDVTIEIKTDRKTPNGLQQPQAHDNHIFFLKHPATGHHVPAPSRHIIAGN
jgi:hypothetical protein